ncbi:MAG: 4-hydroxy-tetrahydrodipicolinate reductase, partial [Myxococcaceae bacterium]
MIRAVVTGVGGRMGGTLVRMIQEEEGMQLVGGTEKPGAPWIGLDLGLAVRLGPLEVTVADDLGKALAAHKADVVIDFTTPDASAANARACAAAGAALVVGSTGLTAEAKEEVSRASARVPVVMSPNMSVGVNLVLEVAAHLAKVLGPSFDVEILESHHRMKKDAPSGTALRLAEVVAASLGRGPEDFCTARQGQVGERPKGQIGIQSLRGGDVVGEHT